MKGPLTRRREHRILAALQAFGPLDEGEISEFIGTPSIFLKKPLMNLAHGKKVSATRQTGLFLPGCFVWSVTDQEHADG